MGLDHWIDAGFGGQDRIDMERGISGGRGKPAKRVKVNAQTALERIRQIAYDALGHRPDASARVFVEDWRTSDSSEAAAERATFEKEQGQS